MDTYGDFLVRYMAYIENSGMEFKLGRLPALQAMGVGKGMVLNFGCGPAVNSKELQAAGFNVIGIDVSEEELGVARELDPMSEYLHYDGAHLADALGDRKVDGILASFSFCVIPEEVLLTILYDMRQLLELGGKLVVVDPNHERSLGIKYPDLHYHAQPGVKSGDYVHVTLGSGQDAVELYHDIYRTHADYRRLLKEAGFVIDKMEEPCPESTDKGLEMASRFPPYLLIVAH